MGRICLCYKAGTLESLSEVYLKPVDVNVTGYSPVEDILSDY